MKRLLLPLLAALALPTAISLPTQASWWNPSDKCNKKEFSSKELTQKSKPGVVMISAGKTTGSGFVVRHIRNQTLILTNSHVIKGANNITVEWPDGNTDSALVVLDGGATTTLNDLALLKVSGKEGKVLPLKKGQAIVGGEVIAIGAPEGLSFTLTKGVVSSLRDSGRIIQTDTAINPGSSGGPLINQSGCVIGVNTLGMIEREGLNFAISSEIALRFIDKYDPKNPPFNSKVKEQITVINKTNKEIEKKTEPPLKIEKPKIVKQTQWKNFGKLSIDLANIQIDSDHFNEYREVVFFSGYKKNGYDSGQTFDVICVPGDNSGKWSWENNEWEWLDGQDKSDEMYMARAICNKMMRSSQVYAFLESRGWTKYGRSSWVDSVSWQKWDNTKDREFYTNYYDPNHTDYSTARKISVNCSTNEISFEVYNFGDDSYWNNWVSLPDPYDQIVYDKCN